MTEALKQSTRKADRLIHQLGEVILRQGELSAMLVCEPHLNWHPSPINALIKRRSHIMCGCADNWSLCVWSDVHVRENSANPLTVLKGLFRGLAELVIESRDKLPEELRRWASLGTQNSDLLWGSFVAGFVTTSLNGYKPRTHRLCWGPNNSYYNADQLDLLRERFKKLDPNWLCEDMPPNDDCWLVRTDSFIQTSIDATEYLGELKTLELVEDSIPQKPTSPEFLGLEVDELNLTIERAGYKRIELKSKNQWHSFMTAYKSGKNGATQAALENGYPGDLDGISKVKSRLKDNLQSIGISLSNGAGIKLILWDGSH